MRFSDRLELVLSLTIGTDRFVVPAGAVVGLQVEAELHGFDARLVFDVSAETEADPIAARFVTSDLLQVDLSIRSHAAVQEERDPDPLRLVGVALEKRLVETVGYAIEASPIVRRRYTVRFQDAARVHWKRHFPCQLYADTNYRAVIDAQRVDGISVKYDWTVLDEDRPHVCLPLHAEGGASFYDWLVQVVDEHQGVLERNYSDGTYRIGGKKSAQSTAQELEDADIESVEITVPKIRRHRPRVSNAFSEKPTTKALSDTQTVKGVLRDVLVRSQISSDMERRAELEEARHRIPDEGARVRFDRYPRVSMAPGTSSVFDEGFSKNLRVAKSKYRTTVVRIEAASLDPIAADLEEETTELEMEVTVELERISNVKAQLPSFTPAVYPIYAEGKIIGGGGTDEERTWLVLDDEKTGLSHQRVDVPLWNQKILVPFRPDFMPGHFFFPAYKHARVLVAIHREEAQVTRFLDWPSAGRLPADSQGDHIVLGKRTEDGTSIRHVYEDGKPVVRLKRTYGQDEQTLQIEEGFLRWTVKENESAQKVEPKYDVKVKVEAAKGQAKTRTQGAIGELTGGFESSSAQVSATLESARAETESAVEGMEAELTQKIDAAGAELDQMAESMSENVERVAGAVGAAKAEIEGALSD